MSGFIKGESRSQLTFMPECLEDYIGEENPVRVVDAFVEALDLSEMGFDAVAAATGRPGYHPGVLLRIYIYGYLNRIQSSRRLERETERNVELMWLTGRLTPDFKTIADFRRDNGKAIRNVCRRFVALCRQLDLFSEATVAIDGSKFKAVNNRDKNFTPHKLAQRMKQIDESIEHYLQELDTADRTQAAHGVKNAQRIQDKLAKLNHQMAYLREIEDQLRQQPDGQISLTDPDARSMATSGRGTGMVAYNVQAAVDTKNHLIVAHDIVNEGHDRRQLANMSFRAREAMGTEGLHVLADRGYFKGPEILQCVEAGITPWVPKTMTSDNKSKGRFDKRDFVYIQADDAYRCPAGEALPQRHSSIEDGMLIHCYYTKACSSCTLKPQCTTGKERRVRRWEHEGVIDAMQDRLNTTPGKMKHRRCTVEHVFGTLKFWMGSSHFLMKRLPHVKTEINLHVLAYNLRRVINLIGAGTLMAALRELAIEA